MYIIDSWRLVSLPASDVQAIAETISDAIARLTSGAEHDTPEAIADELAMALDLILNLDSDGILDGEWWD